MKAKYKCHFVTGVIPNIRLLREFVEESCVEPSLPSNGI